MCGVTDDDLLSPHPDDDPCPECEDDNWSLSVCHFCGAPPRWDEAE